MRVATPSPYLVCRLREINEKLPQLSTGEACALFEQEVGAHTHREGNSFFTALLCWQVVALKRREQEEITAAQAKGTCSSCSLERTCTTA